ncbi:MAG: hypothetical protein U0269_06750 [Polyangiales bacterium]
MEARVGGTVFVPLASADWAIEGRIERRDRSWVATLAAARAPGQPATRVIERIAPDCAAIDEQIVTVIALLLDANQVRATRAAPVDNPPCPALPAPRVERVEVAVVREVPREPVRARRAAFDLSAGAAFEHLPTPAFAAQLGAEWTLAWPTLRLRTALSFVGPSIHELRWSAGQATLTTLTTAAHASLCLAPPSASWLEFCPGATAGLAVGTAATAAASRTTLLPTAALVLRTSAEWPLNDRWSVRVFSELTAQLLTPQFAVVEQDTNRVLAVGSSNSVIGAQVGASISLILPSETR